MLVALAVLGAVPVSPAADATLADFSRVMRRWSVDDGLLGGRVDAVVQTADGNLLIGGSAGLFSFNGQRFEEVPFHSELGWSNKGVSKLKLDEQGHLWLRGWSGKLAVRSDDGWLPVSVPEEPVNVVRWSRHPDGGLLAFLWAGDSHASLVRLKPGDTEILSLELSNRILSAQATPDGRIWLGRYGSPIHELVDGRPVAVPDSKATGIGTFLERRDGTLLALGHSGIFAWRDGAWEEEARLDLAPSSVIQFAVEDLDRRVWFGARESDHMVWNIDGSVQKFRYGQNSLPAVIQDALLDDEGDLWFATFSGLFQARYVPALNWEPPVEMPTTRVVGVRPRPDGTIWFLGFGGICRLSPGDPEPVFESARPAAELTVCDADAAGNVWIGNRYGQVIRRSGDTEQIIPQPGNTRQRIYLLVVDNDGVAWVGWGGQLYRCDPRKEPLSFEPTGGSHGLPEKDRCRKLRLLPDGGMIASFTDEGIYHRAAGELEWERITPPRDRTVPWIRHFDLASDGLLWSSGDRNLVCWKDNAVLKTSLEDLGLAGKIVGLASDDDGGLWFATQSDGVAYLECSDLLAAMEGTTAANDLSPIWFDRSSGLGSRGGSFTYDSIRKSIDGRIWVATDGGLSVIDPHQWKTERNRATPPVVEIESVTADGVALEIGDSLRIPPGTARLGIRYASRSFGFPGELSYRYRLRSLSDDWVESRSTDELSFQGLSPGQYSFEVMAANRFGSWSPEPTAVSFSVLPYWWERADARIGIALAIALVIILVLRSRFRVLHEREKIRAGYSRQLIEAQEEERKKIAHELHDSLGQEMLVLKGRLDLAGMKNPALKEPLAGLSDDFSATIERARALSHDLRPPHLEHFGLSKALEALAGDLRESADLQVHADIDELSPRLSPTREIGLFRIAQEAAANVLKHAEATSITLTLKLIGDRVVLGVRDDGCGFVPEAKRQRGSLGLSGMSERAQLLDGNFDCDSAPGRGTVVTASIPFEPSSSPSA